MSKKKTATPKPTPYSTDEVRKKFLDAVWSHIHYWETIPLTEPDRSRVEGAAFSILAMLDGSNVDIPGFLVIPNPHPDDKAYCIERGERWYPPAALKNDIGGALHEQFYQARPHATGKPRDNETEGTL
jgi:hypothetical protein